VDDNFNGTDGDLASTNRWVTSNPGDGGSTIQGNMLYQRAKVPGSQTYIYSKYQLCGDFDISIWVEPVLPIIGVSSWSYVFEVRPTPSIGGWASININYDNNGPTNWEWITGVRGNGLNKCGTPTLHGPIGNDGSPGYPLGSGYFRIQRVNTGPSAIINLYGSSNVLGAGWTLLTACAPGNVDISNNNVYIQIRGNVYGSAPDQRCTWDNLQVRGDCIICASSSSKSSSSESSSSSSSSCDPQTFTLAGGTSKGNYVRTSLISFADSQIDPYTSFGNTNITADVVSIFDSQWQTRRGWFRVDISLRYVPFLYNFTYLRFRGTLVTQTSAVPNVPATARFVLVAYQGVTEPPSPTDFTSQGVRYTDPFTLLAGLPSQLYTVPLINAGVDYLNSQLAVSASSAAFWLVEYDRDYFGGTPVATDERIYFDFNSPGEPYIFAQCSISSSSVSSSSESSSSLSSSSSSSSESSSSSSISSSSESVAPALIAWQSAVYPASYFDADGANQATWALRFPAAAISNYGNNVRIEMAYVAVPWTVGEVWIGVGAAVPPFDDYDYASPPSQFLFGGSPTQAITAPGIMTDWIPFTIAPATDYVIRVWCSSPSPNDPPFTFFGTGTQVIYNFKIGVNEASSPLDTTGYSGGSANREAAVVKIEVF
jgi:hypothetical protein